VAIPENPVKCPDFTRTGMVSLKTGMVSLSGDVSPKVTDSKVQNCLVKGGQLQKWHVALVRRPGAGTGDQPGDDAAFDGEDYRIMLQFRYGNKTREFFDIVLS